jgi:hypothetical protein
MLRCIASSLALFRAFFETEVVATKIPRLQNFANKFPARFVSNASWALIYDLFALAHCQFSRLKALETGTIHACSNVSLNGLKLGEPSRLLVKKSHKKVAHPGPLSREAGFGPAGAGSCASP